VTRPDFSEYGRTIRVEGGLKARSTRGAIGESWWSKRFLDVLESFAIGGRLSRGRNYARAGQVLRLTVATGEVRATVQGSRPTPYEISVKLAPLTAAAWTKVEAELARQALYSARLLAGEMPAEIEAVFAEAGTPLFPRTFGELRMECSCPDWQVPCKHLAATFYLLAEAFDTDPFQILQWRGRGREELLSHLRALRDVTDESTSESEPRRRKPRTPAKPAVQTPREIGAALAVGDVVGLPLAEALDRFWVAPVPLPQRPPALAADPDLLLRQLPEPGPTLGGRDFVDQLRPLYAALPPP
jgi:uncharacterized Zn finger protein